MLQHKHLIVSAKVSKPPTDPLYMTEWLKKLIKEINMEILIGPSAIYYPIIGNRGMTAFAIITTSHIALHTWDEISPANFEIDVYSCKDFEIQKIFDLLQEFGVEKITYKFLDREKDLTLLSQSE